MDNKEESEKGIKTNSEEKNVQNAESILKKWYFWVIIVLGILVIFLILRQPKTNDNTNIKPNTKTTESTSTIIHNEKQNNNNIVSSKKDTQDIKEIKNNDTIIISDYEFTLNNVSFSYDVKPANPPSWYSHYEAKSGKVYIFIDANIKNTGKTDLRCDKAYSVKADYNNGYTYDGFNVAEDSDGDFTYANITSITPLETLGDYYLIEVPEEVQNNSETPLSLIFTLKDNSKYKYVIR